MAHRYAVRALRVSVALLVYVHAALAHADFIFDVFVDTLPLIGHPAGPFSLEFQLNDGSGTNDGNNTALLSDFEFFGGMPVGSPTLIGGASGALSSNIVLADNEFLNEFFQEFVPGPGLSFHVELTTNVDPGPQPDQFSFAILDCNLVEIPTNGPADALLIVDITANPVVRTFSGGSGRASGCGGAPIPVAARLLPEPSALALISIALLAWAVRHARRARDREHAQGTAVRA